MLARKRVIALSIFFVINRNRKSQPVKNSLSSLNNSLCIFIIVTLFLTYTSLPYRNRFKS